MQGYRRIAGLFGDASITGVERRAGYNACFISPTVEAVEAEITRRIAGRPGHAEIGDLT